MPQFDRITFDRNVMGGKPCIRGMRVTVATIVGLLASGATAEQILADYPYLVAEDIDAAQEFARIQTSATDRITNMFPADRLGDFALRWKVNELALFGSVLRDDFNETSDIDVPVSFNPAATWSLGDLIAMQDELSAMIGRKVDLVEKEALRNPFRRQHIVNGSKVIYSVAQP